MRIEQLCCTQVERYGLSTDRIRTILSQYAVVYGSLLIMVWSVFLRHIYAPYTEPYRSIWVCVCGVLYVYTFEAIKFFRKSNMIYVRYL